MQTIPSSAAAASGEPLAEIEVGVIAGRAACVAIRAAQSDGLTTLLLRQLPGLGKLVREVVAANAVRVTRTEDGQVIGEYYVDASEFSGLDAVRQELIAETEAQLAPQRRRPLSDEFLADVADVYREALAAGSSTGRAIQERWPSTEANARRWISRARKAGFLGDAPGVRRAGEQPIVEPGNSKSMRGGNRQRTNGGDDG